MVLEEVHYVPVGFGYRQYAVPLVADTRFDPDKVIILRPVHGSDERWYIENVRDHLAGHEVEVTERGVETDDFVSVVKTAYTDIRDELAPDEREHEGNEVYINTASQHWAIGAGYATAASLLISEIESGDSEKLSSNVSNPRDRLTMYYTEPDEYRLNDLLSATTQVRTLQREFRTAAEIAKKRKDEIADNKQIVDQILKLLGESDLDLNQALELVRELDARSDEDSEIVEAIEDIFRGIERVTAGVQRLDDNREKLPTIGPLTDIGEGLARLSEDAASDDEELTPADLLGWVQNRLDDVNELATGVADQYDELDEKMDRPPEELLDFVAKIESEGIAHDVKTFDGTNHMELPGPLQFDLTSTRKAILDTLNERGAAGSYVELAIRVNQMALERAEMFSDDQLTDDAVKTFRTGSVEKRPPLWKEYLQPSTQELISNNAKRLEEMGFVSIQRVGGSNGVSLTRAGEVYMNAREFDDDWHINAYGDISETISPKIDEFIEQKPN